ncbi:MAG: hypothetical protein KDJ88_09225 [Bauldia sp.]|nr:hypothetical protein [Bauldia sp.]
MLAFVFVAGCALGSLLYLFVAETPLAHSQEVVADTIGDTIDMIRHRFGHASSAPVRRRVRAVHPEEDYVDYHPAEPQRRAAEPQRREAARYRPRPLPPPAVEAGIPEPAHAEAEHYNEAYDEGLVEQAYPDEDWGEATAHADHHDAYPEHWHEHGEEVWEDEHEALPAPAALPQAALPPPGPAPVAPEPPVVEELPAMRPAGLAAPRNGVPDDLQRIRGIGKKNEELLNSIGIFHFGQIAAWTPAEVRWVGIQIKFPERIERDDWIGQATILASGGRTGYIKAEDRKRLAEEEADRPPGIDPD